MEHDAARWLASRLGYNAAADATLSSNCRGNLKGLWEFIITNYKTADSKRHIQHVLDKHSREQEAAARAPEQRREAGARRQRLHLLRKRNADLEQTLTSLQTRMEGKVQEATDQVCEQSLMQQVLQETQSQTLLLQAHTLRGQQLVPELQARLSQLRYTLDTVKARCRNTGNPKAVQQQLAALSEYIKDGLSETMWETVQQQGIPPAGFADAHSALDQHHAPDAATAGSQGPNSHHQQQQSSVADALQQLMRVCKLLHSYKLPHDVVTSALQLLQHSPAVLWDTCTQLARHNLQELTSQLDEAEREMLAPLHWPGSSAAGAGAQHALVQHKSDQQQLVVYGNTGSSGGGGGKHKLPWASGLSLPCAAAMQELGISPPPEVRIKLRLHHHIQLHVRTEQTLQRAQAADRELTMLLGSTPLLQAPAVGSLGWEGELARVYLNLVKARAQLALLQDFEEHFTNELLQLKEIKAITQDKDRDVKLQMEQDEELNRLLHLAAMDTFELSHALLTHQPRVAQLLNQQLLPCGAAAAQAAQAAVGRQWGEVEAVQKLPVLGLAEPVGVSGLQEQAGTSSTQSCNPVLRKSTLSRLQSAGQQLLLAGRATTGALRLKGAAVGGGGHDVLALAGGSSSDGSRRFGDRAAVAALKGAAMLDPVAPLRCPAALLLDVKGQCMEAKQLQQQLEVLSNTSMSVAASINAAVQQEGQLQEKVDLLHQCEREQVLPQLHALLEEGQAAHVFAQEQVMADLQQFWDMPAMHLRPKHLYQGKNCSQWLLELQQLHMQKKELSTGHPHMA